MPRVSVIMGVYNGVKTLRRAIESIQYQTFTDWEFIICDDCSTDKSYELMQELSKEDTRIIIIRNEKNSGLSFTLNHCIEFSNGEYLARMDDDDISLPERFEKQVDYLDQNPKYDIVGTCRNTFDNDGIWKRCCDYGELSKEDIVSGRIFTHPTVMMRKKAVVAVGGYTVSERTLRGQDYDMWCKLYENGSIGYVIPDVLLNYFEDRNTIKEAKFRFRYNNFKTHMIWRQKMSLPFWYDIFALKEIAAVLIPNKFLVSYKKKNQRNNRML